MTPWKLAVREVHTPQIPGQNHLIFPLKLGSCQMKITEYKPITTANHATANAMVILKNKARGICDALCQYIILISNWVSHGTLITAIWHQVISCLDSHPHNEDKIWQMASAKVKDALPSEILEIKNNSPELVDIIFIPNPNAFLDIETGSEEFNKHYQNLAPTKEKQKQCLEEINI
ncbi:hypothetical protein G9A89_009087 [Geosiphon pyriformis]|nr:hypothetical protein G9A89_009087 [Geosiphon pyriformis]